jgi:thiol-disulfide isomerase/thioredoxin
MKTLVPALFLSCLALAPTAPSQAIRHFKFEVTTLGGRKLTQDDFENNVLIVDFWGTWCKPCRDAVPMLKTLYGKYKQYGLEIIGLAYEQTGKSRAEELVREFCAENGLTYPMALGTNKIKRQVIGLQSFPTLLFFKKGLVFSHLHKGYKPGQEQEHEKWVREQLGLDKPATGQKQEEAGEEEKPEQEEEEVAEEGVEKEETEVIEAGKIYKPGNHDTGFDFEAEGLNGNTLRFTDYRGKKVILALTSTWDPEARNTAAVLNRLHERYAKTGTVVLAASLEQARDQDKKVAAIKRFNTEVKPRYTVFPVAVTFVKKLHRTSGLPTYLMFDEKGTLILRQESATAEKVLAAFADAVAGKRPEKGKVRKKPKSVRVKKADAEKTDAKKAEPRVQIPFRRDG